MLTIEFDYVISLTRSFLLGPVLPNTMFGTLRYNSRRGDTEFVDCTNEFLPHDADRQATSHLACDTCRMRKLKCSGQKTGCDRCRVTSTSCMYTAAGEGTSGRRQQRGEDRSSVHSQRSTSSSQSSSASRLRQAMSPPKVARTDEYSDLVLHDSPPQTFEEDFLISDEFLYDMIPGLGSRSLEDFVQTSKSPFQSDLDANSEPIFGPAATGVTTTGGSPARMNPSSAAMRKPDVPGYSHVTSLSPPISTHSEMLPPEQPAYRDSRNVYPSPTTPTGPVDQNVQKARSANSSHEPRASCHCLQTVFVLLENLQNESDLIDSSAIDSVLAFHKKALTQCSILLRCVACMTRPEHLLLFVLVCEKLVNFCEKMVNEYLRRPRGQFEWLAKKTSRDASVCMAHEQKLSIGKYELDLPVELDCLFKVLVALQLKALERLLTEIRKTISSSLHGARVSKLLNNERRLEDLAEKLQRPEVRARQ